MPGEVLVNAVVFGVILSVVLSAVVLGSLRLDATMWAPSYPADVQKRFGQMSQQARRKRVVLALAVYASVVALLWLAIRRLPELQGGSWTFLQVYATTWIVLMTLNLVDWLIVDWFVLMTLKPRWIILPGTDESMAGYHDYGRHFRGFLKGSVGITVVSAVVAGVTLLLVQIFA
jgi:hypothetical protein